MTTRDSNIMVSEATPTRKRGGNYKQGPIEHAADELLDIKACNIEARTALDVFPRVDQHMDKWQDVGYVFVRWIKVHSTDLMAQKAAEQALRAFGKAEELEVVNEGHVANGTHAVYREGMHAENGSVYLEPERGRHCDCQGVCSECGEPRPDDQRVAALVARGLK